MSQAKLKFGCCERQTSSTGFLHCQSCKFRYHLNCVNIQRPLKDLTEDFKLKYICPGCHSKLPKVDNTNTPIRPSSQSATCYQLDEPSTNVNNRRGGQPLHQHEPSVTTEDIRLIIKEELKNVFNNFKVSILKEVERKTQEVLDRFNQISDALKIFEQNQANLKDEVTLNSNRINTLEAENTSLRESVADLRSRLARSEQYSRATNLEIQNVPESKTENLYSVVKQIATVSGYKLEETDIQQCTRIAKINNESRRPRSIIVKFNTQRIRDGFLAAALQFNRKNKNPTDKLNTSQLGIGGDKKPVFVVEHLAPAQKALHAAARAKAKELHYKFVWVRGDVDIKEETLEETYFEDIPGKNEVSSDEDVQLSKLKEETERDKKRKKSEKKKQKLAPKKDRQKKEKNAEKKNRKLKNLPGDLVELYTMSNDEMWVIRWEDLNSKEFQKLKYRCDTCIIAFNTEKLMQDHLNGKHQPKGENCHQCPICEAYFLTKDNLSAHKALHQQGYKCKECGFNTGLKKRMMKHVGEHKTGDSFTCSSCGSSFSTKSKLIYHRAVCRQEKPQCDCCGKVFANKMTLKYHLKILPRNKEEKPKEKLFIPCKGCDKVFHSKKSYRAHVVIHNGLSYPCPICGKLFQWKRNLYRHTRNHRERAAGAVHECRDCGKTFASRDCYNNHMRLSKRHVADEALQHACTYCDKKFPTKWCLTDHVDWDHLKRIKYQCSSCFKPFKTAKILVAHVKNIHEGKKKEVEGEHLCEICGKSYRTVKRLKGHVWAMHTKRSNSKVYKCKLCPATFMWQTSIYKHMKMMHDNKKAKTQRTAPPVKKEEPYPGIELANRMQYFQQNLSGNLNIVHIQPIEIGQNIVFK